MKVLGIALIAAGVAALIYGGFSYRTREKVLDLGPIQATAEREKTIAVPPVAGAVAVGAGTLLLVIRGRRR